jgi:hypothetical protein
MKNAAPSTLLAPPSLSGHASAYVEGGAWRGEGESFPSVKGL